MSDEVDTMGVIEHWPVYFCDACNEEYGPADPGDTTCCGCGRHDAGHIYVPHDQLRGAVEALEKIERVVRAMDESNEGQVVAYAMELGMILADHPAGGQ